MPVAEKNSAHKVQKYILKSLGKTKPGEKLPSMRHIRKVCGVSQSVVEKVIDELRNVNLIEVRPQSGYYKTVDFKPAVRVLFFRHVDLLSGNVNGFYQENLMRIMLYMTNAGRQVHFQAIESLKDLSCFDSTGQSAKLSSIKESLITFSMPYGELENAKTLESRGHRMLHWLPDFTQPTDNTFIINDELLIRSQLEYLISKGHRRIAYLHNRHQDVWSRADHTRYEAFCRMCIELELDIKSNFIQYVETNQSDNVKASDYIKKMLSGPVKPTALLLCGDRWVRGAYPQLRANGFEPGRDISVLGTNNMVWDKYVQPTLTSFGFDLVKGSKVMVERLIQIEKGESFPPFELPIMAAERDSIKQID